VSSRAVVLNGFFIHNPPHALSMQRLFIFSFYSSFDARKLWMLNSTQIVLMMEFINSITYTSDEAKEIERLEQNQIAVLQIDAKQSENETTS
jgi:site-specific recombinase